jgi:hypothetical protein
MPVEVVLSLLLIFIATRAFFRAAGKLSIITKGRRVLMQIKKKAAQ